MREDVLLRGVNVRARVKQRPVPKFYASVLSERHTACEGEIEARQEEGGDGCFVHLTVEVRRPAARERLCTSR